MRGWREREENERMERARVREREENERMEREDGERG
jgi:hypothetical protein